MVPPHNTATGPAEVGPADPGPLADDESPARRQWLRLGLMTALVLQLCWMLNVYPHWRETNSTSRVYLSVAMVEYGTFQIDKCLSTYGDTLDKALYQEHYYSDKAPGTSLMFLPVTWLVAAMSPADQANPEGPALIDMRMLFLALRILCVSLPTVGFWWLTLPWFRAWTGREDRAVAVVAAGALGTNFFIYATQLFAHVPAGWFLFLAFLSVRRYWVRVANPGTMGPGLLGGALAGVGFLNDYVVMLAVATLGVATLLPRFQWRPALGFGLGLAPSLLIWMGYNWICFDHPLRTGFMYHALPLYGNAYQSGFLGIQRFDPSSVLGMLFSPARGMLFVSPVLALAPWGWWRQLRDGTYRGDAICSAVVACVLFLFATTTIDWRGGWWMGTRYLVPAVPFALVGVAGALRNVSAGQVASILFGGWAAVGILLSGAAAATVPLFPQEFSNPIYSVCIPFVAEGYFGPNLLTGMVGSVIGIVPLAAAILLSLYLVLCGGAARSPLLKWGATSLSLLLAFLIMFGQSRLPEPPENRLACEISRAQMLARLGYFQQAAHEISALTQPDVSMDSKEVGISGGSAP